MKSSGGWWTQDTCTTPLTTIIMRFRASFASFLHIGDVEILEVELTDLIDAYLWSVVPRGDRSGYSSFDASLPKLQAVIPSGKSGWWLSSITPCWTSRLRSPVSVPRRLWTWAPTWYSQTSTHSYSHWNSFWNRRSGSWVCMWPPNGPFSFGYLLICNFGILWDCAPGQRLWY